MGIPIDLETKTKESVTVGKPIVALTCSFCGMTEYEVPTLIQGPSSCICSFCIENMVYTVRGVFPGFCKADHMPEYDD